MPHVKATIFRGQQERNDLALKNIGLVKHTANKFRSSRLKLNLPRDDANQEAAIALLYAAETFDESKGFTFCTYAVKCIWNALYIAAQLYQIVHVPRHAMELKVKQGRARARGEDFPLTENQADLLALVRSANGCSRLPPEYEVEATATEDLHEDLQEGMQRLKPAERVLLEQYYWQDLTYGEIAEVEGVSRQRIAQRVHDAVDKLRRILNAAARN